MMDADLRYEKSRENAGIRQSMWLPTLGRTHSNKLTIQHAANNKRGQYRLIHDELPIALGWQWDDREGAKYFYTKLTAENLKELLNWAHLNWQELNISKGVRAWQAQNK